MQNKGEVPLESGIVKESYLSKTYMFTADQTESVIMVALDDSINGNLVLILALFSVYRIKEQIV